MKIDAILSPKELPSLAQMDLGGTACVVFDILRATSTFVTALQSGAKEIIPVDEISAALEFRKNHPAVLLGGERDGIRISVDGIDFDLGNSPYEYLPERVRGKTIVSTTTNGTRALRTCAHAKTILASSFLNLETTADYLCQKKFEDVLLVCAGTRENAALEDILAAGAMCEALFRHAGLEFSDAAQTAFAAYCQARDDLVAAVCNSENAQRLFRIPGLRNDVKFCLRRNLFSIVAEMKSGAISIV